MDNNKRTGSGCLTGIIVLIVIIVLALIGSGMESDYERAGKEFETWIGEDPRTWTDTEKQYFEDFWEWADENQIEEGKQDEKSIIGSDNCGNVPIFMFLH